MSTKDQVLSIPRSDAGSDSFILVHVTADGPSALDLRLIATEGESPYVGTADLEFKVRQDQIQKLRAKSYDGNGEDWERTVAMALHQQPAQDRSGQAIHDFEVVSSVGNQQVVITLRKNIGGITQRLGTINMAQDDEQAIELFYWTRVATTATMIAESNLASLTSQYEGQENTILKLNKQLEELIRAKEEHENTLLVRFRELLNTKKRKIRDQQRLLADATVDSRAAAQVQEARGFSRPRKSAPSGDRKRKLNGSATNEDFNSDDDGDGFEDTMLERQSADVERGELVREETPDKSDLDETEDEAGEDDDSPPSPSARGQATKGRAIQTVKQSLNRKTAEHASPPPRRELPFLNAKQDSAIPHQSLRLEGQESAGDDGPESDEETDDDDEL